LCLFYHIVKKKAIFLSFDIYCNTDEFYQLKLSIFIKCTSDSDDLPRGLLCIFPICDNLCIFFRPQRLLCRVLRQDTTSSFYVTDMFHIAQISCHLFQSFPLKLYQNQTQ